MPEVKTLIVSSLEKWRDWLEKNNRTEKEIWLVYYKKHTNKSVLDYEKTVEEALSYGWIDSLIKKIDDDMYARKFTPRTNNLKWSALNLKRVKKLISEGRMCREGLYKIPSEILEENHKSEDLSGIKKPNVSNIIPQFIEKALKDNQCAGEFFNKLAPSHKKHYILWISSAKRQETREKRLAEAIDKMTRGEKLGLK